MTGPIEQLKKFYNREKRMPSYSEMMSLFGFKSKNAVYRLVQKMLSNGVVEQDHLGRLLPTSIFNDIPMGGLVKAGLPSSVDAQSESVNLNDLLISKKNETYLLEVDGDSMIEAHIEPGDMVVVERTQNAKEGDIVIAMVDREHTMKYFRKDSLGKIYLQPANKAYKNIYPSESLEIVGVVRGVVRKY
ncbi:MAG TPA: S24 family peptidase [Candidatus Paceibacterota bacterium]|nr:S24 family peptidase [Candidatus Paceibacterota bacterium]